LRRTAVIPVHMMIASPRVEIVRNGTSLFLSFWVKPSFLVGTCHMSFIMFCRTWNAPIAPMLVKTMVVMVVSMDVNGVIAVSKICCIRLAMVGPTTAVMYWIRFWKESV